MNKKYNELKVLSYEDIITARQLVRSIADELGFSLLDQTRLITAVSELARNIIVHAQTGKILIEQCSKGTGKIGLKCVFIDQGPGMQDVSLAMREGYSSSGSLGIGLSGAKKLSDEFSITSHPGSGTKISIVKWKT